MKRVQEVNLAGWCGVDKNSHSNAAGVGDVAIVGRTRFLVRRWEVDWWTDDAGKVRVMAMVKLSGCIGKVRDAPSLIDGSPNRIFKGQKQQVEEPGRSAC